MKITENNKYPLKEEDYKKIEEIIDRYRNKNGALIQVLNEIQKEIGFLPISAQKKVANGLDIPEKEVYGVTTFYSFFFLNTAGQNEHQGLPGNRLLCKRWKENC